MDRSRRTHEIYNSKNAQEPLARSPSHRTPELESSSSLAMLAHGRIRWESQTCEVCRKITLRQLTIVLVKYRCQGQLSTPSEDIQGQAQPDSVAIFNFEQLCKKIFFVAFSLNMFYAIHIHSDPWRIGRNSRKESWIL